MVSQELQVITANHLTMNSSLCTSATHLLARRSVQTTKFTHYCYFQLCAASWRRQHFSIWNSRLDFSLATYRNYREHLEHFMCTIPWLHLLWPQRSYITRDIVATDGGNRSTSVELAVTITNVKNQPPQWEQENYGVVIPENTARDTPIVVRAQLHWNRSCH